MDGLLLLLGAAIIGGGLVVAGVCIGYRLAQHRPPLPEMGSLVLPMLDSMPGPFSGPVEGRGADATATRGRGSK